MNNIICWILESWLLKTFSCLVMNEKNSQCNKANRVINNYHISTFSFFSLLFWVSNYSKFYFFCHYHSNMIQTWLTYQERRTFCLIFVYLWFLLSTTTSFMIREVISSCSFFFFDNLSVLVLELMIISEIGILNICGDESKHMYSIILKDKTPSF